METQKFETDETYFPCTMQQFEDLTNEILSAINVVVAPNFLTGDYLAQILMSALHGIDHKHGIVKKSELFLSCINRIGCHVTFHAVEEIQRRINEQHAKDNPQPLKVIPDIPSDTH
jgi:hypothetical protein